MNCLEFRRMKLADPRRRDPAALTHLSKCSECRNFAVEVNAAEDDLCAALEVAVPEGLAERIILRRKTGVRALSRFTPRLWALAASIVLSVGIGFGWWRDYASQDFARLAIEHVMHEPESFTTTRSADPELFRTVMQSFGGTLDAPLGRVRYMKLCPVPEGTGWHIVVETSHGLATLILIPDRHMKSESERASVGGWNALARPGGQGFYAIIADSPEALARMDALVRERVRWRG